VALDSDRQLPRKPATRVQHLKTMLDGAIGTIVLNNEKKRNALSKQLVDGLVETLNRFSCERTRVIILRARPGAKVWSSGHDVSELPEGRRDPLGWDDPLRYLVRAIEAPKSGHSSAH
jgi:methylmalonyl-CoA decarboxylase